MSDTHLCRDCKHIRIAEGERYRSEKCGHDIAINIVTGVAEVSCEDMRKRYTRCGQEGLLFDPKPAPLHEIKTSEAA